MLERNQKGVLFMALWIIAIVLVVVFFPFLFNVAATAAIIIIPIGTLLFSVGTIIYFASTAVANPKLGQRVALGIMIFYIFLQLPQVIRWMYEHSDGSFYILMPIVAAYAVCLFMLSKNRSMGGKNGVIGISLLLVGLLTLTFGELLIFHELLTFDELYTGNRDGAFMSLPVTIILLLLRILIVLGYVLLLKVPAHSDTSAEEKNAVLLIVGGFLVEKAHQILLILLRPFYHVTGVAIPGFLNITIKYGSLLLLIAGTVLYAKFMLGRAKSKEK